MQNEGRHDNETSCAAPVAAGSDHVAPVHSVERPRSSTAVQNVDELHDVAAMPFGALDAPDQAAPLQVKKLPPKSVAMQNVEEVHETTAPICVGGVGDAVVHDAPFHVSVLPCWSTTAQKVVDGHDTELGPPVASKLDGDDHDKPFHVKAFPAPSTAMQNVDRWHDTELRAPPGSMVDGEDHDAPFQVKALPCWSTTTEKVVDGHETAVGTSSASRVDGDDHDEPFHIVTFAANGHAEGSRRGRRRDSARSRTATGRYWWRPTTRAGSPGSAQRLTSEHPVPAGRAERRPPGPPPQPVGRIARRPLSAPSDSFSISGHWVSQPSLKPKCISAPRHAGLDSRPVPAGCQLKDAGRVRGSGDPRPVGRSGARRTPCAADATSGFLSGHYEAHVSAVFEKYCAGWRRWMVDTDRGRR